MNLAFSETPETGFLATMPKYEILTFSIAAYQVCGSSLQTTVEGFYIYVQLALLIYTSEFIRIEPLHEISNNVLCATSKASDQPAHTRSLIRAFASRLSIWSF